MSEKNKAVARRFLDALWNRNNFDVVEELLARDYDGHSSTVIRGPDGAMAFIPVARAAFPDFRFEVLDQINEIEVIAVGTSIRNLAYLEKTYGSGRWRKLKGKAHVKLPNGNIRWVELHWYEVHGIGRKDIKIKRYLG